jgi:hypothetical protein
VSASRESPKTITEKFYTFELPHDWEAFQLEQAPPNALSWRNTADNKGVRVITVYLDGAPANFAVNRVLPVQAAGERFGVVSDVSDNCTNFTEPLKPNPTDTAPAKWQNVSFICDTGNFARNVVGTGSAEGLNTVKLTGATMGQHSIFITYIDASGSPNFSIFTTMLRSFSLR